MRNNFLKIFLVLVILFSLVACCQVEQSEKLEAVQPTVSFEIPTEVPTEAPTEAPTEPPTEAPTEPPVFSNEITYTLEFNEGTKDFMPYFLYIPSTRENSTEPIPMIIWLHGGDEYYCKEELMKKRGLPAALEKWGDLEKFDAYILCPQWTGRWSKIAGWHNETIRAGLDLVIADVLSKNYVDTNKIIISGHSMGGRGAICNALHNKNEFEYYKVATVSGFLDKIDMPYVRDLDIRFYTGMPATGEYTGIYSYNTKTMVELFGEEGLFVIEGSHGNSPVPAFLLDEDGNNRSDLIEWMLSD